MKFSTSMSMVVTDDRCNIIVGHTYTIVFFLYAVKDLMIAVVIVELYYVERLNWIMLQHRHLGVTLFSVMLTWHLTKENDCQKLTKNLVIKDNSDFRSELKVDEMF